MFSTRYLAILARQAKSYGVDKEAVEYTEAQLATLKAAAQVDAIMQELELNSQLAALKGKTELVVMELHIGTDYEIPESARNTGENCRIEPHWLKGVAREVFEKMHERGMNVEVAYIPSSALKIKGYIVAIVRRW